MPASQCDERHVAHVGLGSNMGDRELNLRRALQAIDARPDIEVTAVSSFHETEPVGGPPQDAYLNAAATVRTTLSARGLLDALHGIEAQLGRERGARWGPRTLDLDLLLYDDVVNDEPGLVLPRDDINRYAFVLRPLAELAGGERHPVSGQTYDELWAAFDADSQPMQRVDWPPA